LGAAEHFPAVTRAELDAVINAFARTLARYVADDKLDEAEAFMCGELGLAGQPSPEVW